MAKVDYHSTHNALMRNVEMGFTVVFADSIIRTVNMAVERDPTLRGMALMAVFNLTCKHHPTDWWQAFKERWYPGFLLRRYPVKYEYAACDPEQFKEAVRRAHETY